jgi:hypothetical protein
MIESYWDLYVAYIDKCVRDNWANDIDPAHYEMEWNHFLPQCIFEDQPIGHWLTKRQHAIASALQTLVFRQNCMCGWHKKYLSAALLRDAWPYFGLASSNRAREGKGFHNFEQRSRAGQKAFELELGVHSRDYRESEEYLEQRRKAGLKTAELKIGLHSPGMASLGGNTAVKLGKGIHSPEHRGKGVKVTNSQVWESTMDGFRSNPGVVAKHNRANGWDPNARVRIS